LPSSQSTTETESKEQGSKKKGSKKKEAKDSTTKSVMREDLCPVWRWRATMPGGSEAWRIRGLFCDIVYAGGVQGGSRTVCNMSTNEYAGILNVIT
jgi:hypothetical protein